MHIRQRLKQKERWLYLLSLAKSISELTILIGILIVVYIIIRQIL